MKVEPKAVYSDAGNLLLSIGGEMGNMFANEQVYSRSDVAALLQLLIHYAQHGTFCPPPPKPLDWKDHNDWCSTAGEYAILRVDSGTFYELFHRGHWLKRLVTMRSARDAAQAHADQEARRESR